MKTTQNSYTLCESCRRAIRPGESQRLILSYRLHNTDECFHIYTVKVEKVTIKVPFNSGKGMS